MFSIFSSKIFFEQIDFVVLKNNLSSLLSHISGSLGVTESGISLHLLDVSCLVRIFLVINIFRPSTFFMHITSRSGGNFVGVNTVSRKLRNIGEDNSSWITTDIFISLVWIRGNHTEDFSLSIIEGSMSTKFFPLLLISVLLGHMKV